MDPEDEKFWSPMPVIRPIIIAVRWGPYGLWPHHFYPPEHTNSSRSQSVDKSRSLYSIETWCSNNMRPGRPEEKALGASTRHEVGRGNEYKEPRLGSELISLWCGSSLARFFAPCLISSSPASVRVPWGMIGRSISWTSNIQTRCRVSNMGPRSRYHHNNWPVPCDESRFAWRHN